MENPDQTSSATAADEMVHQGSNTPQSSSEKGRGCDIQKKVDNPKASDTARVTDLQAKVDSQQKVLDYIAESLGEQTSAFKEFAFYTKEKIQLEKARDIQNSKDPKNVSVVQSKTDNNGRESAKLHGGGHQEHVSCNTSGTHPLSCIFEDDIQGPLDRNRRGLPEATTGDAQYCTPNRERKNKTGGAAGSNAAEKIDDFSDDSDLEFDDDILQEYDDKQDETVTAAVHPVLAKRVDKLLSTKTPPTELKELVSECKRAQNVNNLRNISVNSEIYSLMSSKQRQIDHAQRQQAHCLQKSLCPITSVLDKLISFEQSLDKTEEGRIVYSETQELNITQIRRELDKSMKLIATVFYNLTMRRRQNIRSALDPSYAAICGPQVNFTDKLFGDDLEATLQSLSSTNKLKLKASRKPTTPRFRPYYRGASKNFQSQRGQRPPFQRPAQSQPRGRPVFHRRGVARRAQFSRGGRSSRR